MCVSPKAEWIMAQFLRRLFCSREQALKGKNDRPTPDVFAVSSELAALGFRFLAAQAPGEAYGAHWLTR